MKRLRILYVVAILSAFVITVGCAPGAPEGTGTPEGAGTGEAAMEGDGPPGYEVDPSWPKPLPNNWLLGQVAGVAVDSQDRVWIAQRPGTLEAGELRAATDPPSAECCAPTPSIIAFDTEGNVVSSWGGPGEGYDWPTSEHGIFIDHMDNVWIGSNGADDHQVLKFSPDGTFLLQLGQAGMNEGSNSTQYLGRPADIYVDPEANEVYVADGYLNKRVIVFDADTGEYKRHWGAYGNEPDDADPGPYDPDAPAAQQFRNPVHCVRIADDGLVYVCDRLNNRIQVFQKDGTFVDEVFMAKGTMGAGAVWDVDFSPDQAFLYIADGTNQKVSIMKRDGLEVMGSFGRHGRNAGQFHWVHNMAVDSQGNLYTSEVHTGRRVQKFVRQGEAVPGM